MSPLIIHLLSTVDVSSNNSPFLLCGIYSLMTHLFSAVGRCLEDLRQTGSGHRLRVELGEHLQVRAVKVLLEQLAYLVGAPV